MLECIYIHVVNACTSITYAECWNANMYMLMKTNMEITEDSESSK